MSLVTKVTLTLTLLLVTPQVNGCEGSLGLVLGLVSSIEQYFCRNSMLFLFFVVVFTATESPHILNFLCIF